MSFCERQKGRVNKERTEKPELQPLPGQIACLDEIPWFLSSNEYFVTSKDCVHEGISITYSDVGQLWHCGRGEGVLCGRIWPRAS